MRDIKPTRKECFNLIDTNLNMDEGTRRKLLLYFAPNTPKIAKDSVTWVSKAVDKKDSRPNLRYMYSSFDGHLYGTNGHVCLRTKQHNYTRNSFVCPKTFKELDMDDNFPDMTSFFGQYKNNNNVKTNTNDYELIVDYDITVLKYPGIKLAVGYSDESFFNKKYIDIATNGDSLLVDIFNDHMFGENKFGEFLIMKYRYEKLNI